MKERILLRFAVLAFMVLCVFATAYLPAIAVALG
jgi:hypothetical protein